MRPGLRSQFLAVALLAGGALSLDARADDAVSGAASTATTPATAASAPESPASAPAAPAALFQPAAWRRGEWAVTPQVSVAAGYNDNLRAQATDVIESPFVAVIPDLAAVRTIGDDQYQVGWHGEWTRFTRSHDDDTDNNALSASGLEVLDEHDATAWRAGWQDWHEQLGLAVPTLEAPTPDHFRAFSAGGVWRHDAGGGDAGGDGTNGDVAHQRLELEAAASRKRYLNHRDVTILADADTASLAARWFHLDGDARRDGLELRALRTHYPTDLDVLSNNDVHASVVWQRDATDDATWSASASAGVEQRIFDHARPTYRGFAWDVQGQWRARPGTTWTLASTRGAADAPGEDVDEVVTTRVTLSVTHDATARWHLAATAVVAHDAAIGSPFPRDDDVHSLDLSVHRDLARTLQLTLNLGWMQRRSQEPAFDFTRRLWSLVLSAAI
jgi:hypothetical protein